MGVMGVMGASTPEWAVTTSIGEVSITADAVGVVRMTPWQCWQALMSPEAAPIFRVQSRELLAGGLCADSLEEQVNFVAPMRVLFWKAWARTCVTQRADFSRRDSEVTVDFGLVHSDLMAKLEGSWRFTLLRTPGACAGAGPMAADDPRWPLCRVQYTFSMWPKGVPLALRRLPGLMDAVKGTVARESVQLLDKLAYIVGRMASPTTPVAAALRLACGEVERAGSYKKLAADRASLFAPLGQSGARQLAAGGRSGAGRLAAAAAVAAAAAQPAAASAVATKLVSSDGGWGDDGDACSFCTASEGGDCSVIDWDGLAEQEAEEQQAAAAHAVALAAAAAAAAADAAERLLKDDDDAAVLVSSEDVTGLPTISSGAAAVRDKSDQRQSKLGLQQLRIKRRGPGGGWTDLDAEGLDSLDGQAARDQVPAVGAVVAGGLRLRPGGGSNSTSSASLGPSEGEDDQAPPGVTSLAAAAAQQQGRRRSSLIKRALGSCVRPAALV